MRLSRDSDTRFDVWIDANAVAVIKRSGKKGSISSLKSLSPTGLLTVCHVSIPSL